MGQVGCSKKSDHHSTETAHREPRPQRRQLRLPVEAVLATYCHDNCALRFEGNEEIRAGRESGSHPGHSFHLTDEDTGESVGDACSGHKASLGVAEHGARPAEC